MSLVPAIKCANDGKPGAAGAEGGGISHGDDNGSEIHLLFLRDVMDDLILCSHIRLPNLFYLCGVCVLPAKGCQRVQIWRKAAPLRSHRCFIESHADDVILQR